jgi:hypothetical protein
MRTMLSITVLLAAASLVSTLPALALSDEEHFPPGMMMGRGCGSSGMMGGRHMMGGRMWRIDAEAQGRLAYRKAELAIADAQAEAWQGYADVVAAQASAVQAADSGYTHHRLPGT